MTIWQQHDDVAYVSNEHRVCLLDLTRLDQLPVILEGSALAVYDAVDGTRDTDAVIAHLTAAFPHVHGLADQVRDCLDDLATTGLILPV